MLCFLWIMFPIFALLVDAGGAGSGSAEAKAGGGNGKAGGGVKGGVMGNVANQGAMNGVMMNGQPFLAQVIPVGGSFLIQQPGAPIGQAAVPQLVSIGPFRQFGALPVGQAGAANGVPQLQGQLPQLPNGAVPLYAILPQPNAMGGPQAPVFIPAQVQMIPVGGGNMQQPGAAPRGAAKVKRWLVGGEVEESSGTGTTMEVKQTS
ncbi:uncharacterized protein LOC134033290 [Osmerus eperlanus]|uniref:uncharacterized protein LOC134033290 n=1 Tax=Osmerus eperlanus TaxID=29151 RepID=UPI002E13831C